MINAFLLSLGQLFDRRIVAVFLKSLLVTLLLFVGAGFGLWYLMHWLTDATPAGLEAAAQGGGFFGSIAGGLAGMFRSGPDGNMVADLMTLILLLLGAWLLFRVIAIAVIGVFADEVVQAVEAKHYPDAHAAARDVSLGRSVAMGLGSAGRVILINIFLSPLYLILLVTGVGTAIAFFIVNAWLLGRDLGDMVAARHMPDRELNRWRRGNRFRRLTLGAVGTGLFLVPGLNLVAPIIGAAMAAHLFHVRRVK